MKIKKLEIIGFKSFLDKASISFPSGISAIVGPNGCGKSNVIDAFRWVMGEQSVKQLRGKAMEDIIFSGAHDKPPLNMAEVTLTLVNDNGNAPEEFRDYAEISVTRRLYRSGESAYLINKQPCRLKDIYNLFIGSGMGTRTFAIIQQGNIGAIIDAGPDERRLFLEEAAGVTRYKFRKNEALRKVKATEQNLLRINDIITEVGRQMAGLRRQAKKAERYKQFQDRAKSIDMRLLQHYFDDFSRQIGTAEAMVKSLKDADLAHVTQLKKIDAAVEDIKLRKEHKDKEIAAQKSRRFDTQRTIDRLENEREHLNKEAERLSGETSALSQAQAELTAKTTGMDTEVAQVESQNVTLQTQIGQMKDAIEAERTGAQSLQQQLAHLNQSTETNKSNLMQLVAEEARYKNICQTASSSKENLKRRLKRIDEEVLQSAQKVSQTENTRNEADRELSQAQAVVVDCEARINDLKTQLKTQSEALGVQVKLTQTTEQERNKSRAELMALKKTAANFDWYRDGVKALMQARQTGDTSNDASPALEGIVGLLADAIDPEPGYETATEAVLGDALQYILVQDQDAGAAAIAFLHSGGAGRSGFLPMSGVKPLSGSRPADIPEANRLLSHVAVQPKFRPIAEALLGHVAVVPTLAEALSLFNKNGRVQTIVTQQGDAVTHQGALVGGSTAKLAGILTKKQELKALEIRTNALDQQAAEATTRQQALEASVRTLDTQLQQAFAEKNEAAEETMAAEKYLYRITEDLKNAKRHHEILQLEQEQLLGEESDLDEEMSKYNRALAKIASDVEQLQNQAAQSSRELIDITEQLETHNQRIVDMKLQLTAFQSKLENGVQTLNRLVEFRKDSRTRLAQLSMEITQKQEKQQMAAAKAESHMDTLSQLYDTLKHLEEEMSANESEYSTIDAALQESDEKQAVIRSEREETLDKMRLLELDLSEKRVKHENIAGKVQEKYHISMAALRMQLAQQPELQINIPDMEKELERLRTSIANIGDVNLGAIKEYEALQERFQFLSTQRDDLVKAIDDLHKVIRKINRITQERFMATFDQVNHKLQEVFPKLFEGGTGRLELTEPNKPLETGVEYMVHPPGKKLTRMSLLSGGEKALSAIAFIFAIFLIRPTSFCLLDEIDAPLDEANVVRFNNLMRVIGEKSQIIMITHNKKSMEFAETLFGVTMEKKGISKVVSVNLNDNAKAA
ncbi:MAG: chromosome segregation protein SMC [Desulfatitalea sp.]|nr:chromosome segregation protein SMC [Desulfatitalea sp.]NNK01619.1 chromosome segregation protein SMC [Desulfatitalea sp.]